MADIYALSGHASDIQDAVDSAVNGDDVHIPPGTFNFVDEAPWITVTIPAGINLFGAPTSRTSNLEYDDVGQDPNDQVVSWNTVLIIPYAAPGTWSDIISWFQFSGALDPNKPSRFSDIKLVGYRSIDDEDTAVQEAVRMTGVVNFRIDHCYFEHTGLGLGIRGATGVVDHNYLINPVASTTGPTMDDWDVYYGVVMSGDGVSWEPDTSKVLGKTLPYTTFIENNYLEKWRHCIASNMKPHYIFRHNTIQDDFGFGSIDAHAGNRAVEIYNNDILDAFDNAYGTFMRGGAGVAFDNRFGGGSYSAFIYFSNEGEDETIWINDWWIWDNTMLSGETEIIKWDPTEDIIEGINYFKYEPHTFSYSPYTYPHPFTEDDGGFEMEQEKYDKWTKEVKALKRHRGLWGTEETIMKILRLLEDVLDTLEP